MGYERQLPQAPIPNKLTKLGKPAVLRALKTSKTVTAAAKVLNVSRQALTRYMGLNGISIKRQIQVTQIVTVEAEEQQAS